MLAAKEAHKKMLRKMRANWYELLNDDSDSDGEAYDEQFDELNNNIRNLNFNSNTNNYYADIDKKDNNYRLTSSRRNLNNETSGSLQLHQSISKKEKNQLKTNSLRKSLTKIMTLAPDKSRIWNVPPFEELDSEINYKVKK